ncbi:MAG: helix-turn-helix domain-containing protein [Erysipelotrichaceae bacterium]|nr:helix-turn-helix domain-containing protein [Erysipelotrichaceae bacterium]
MKHCNQFPKNLTVEREIMLKSDKLQEGRLFLDEVNKLKQEHWTEKEIAAHFHLTIKELRMHKSQAKKQIRGYEITYAKKLRIEGKSYQEIADIMGYNNDSSVRSLLNTSAENRMNMVKKTADILKTLVDEKGMIEVGAGVELELNISRNRFEEALFLLKSQKYLVYKARVAQLTNPRKYTTITVLCPPGTKYKEIYHFKSIHTVVDYQLRQTDDAYDDHPFIYPKSMDSKRLKICYAEEGGLQKDGLIELRRNVADLSLGNAHYAQIRILVDHHYYLKGMAVYTDHLPDGIDVLFYTSKPSSMSMENVLKPIKEDADNPFGSLIKERGGQSFYMDDKGKQCLSLINKRSDEGDWSQWTDKLPSQFLSKQSLTLIQTQLERTITERKKQLETICSIKQPTIKKHMLNSFAEDCDSAAIHLKATALPGQKFQVLLPLPSLKDTEVYAPQFANMEKVALIRFPHGGIFEIPILTVNNEHAEAKEHYGELSDAIVINDRVAKVLSGADFDGDCVMVIPVNEKLKIKHSSPLKELEGFEPEFLYGTVRKNDGYYNKKNKKIHVMNNTQIEMGKISNLITDMTLKNASIQEIARAVRHSMVVIDAEKHKLDYKQSAVDHNIAELKRKYQGKIDKNGVYHEGASTLLSKAKSDQPVLKRQGDPIIDKETGELHYKEVKEEYIDKKSGKKKLKMMMSTKMAETKNAYELSSGTPKEALYAEYANACKSLANQARKEMLKIKKEKISIDVKRQYRSEIASLQKKLKESLKNAPRERIAQIEANAEINMLIKNCPDLSKGELSKRKQQALFKARMHYHAKRKMIQVTKLEWQAIQAGALSENKLSQLMHFIDMNECKEHMKNDC